MSDKDNELIDVVEEFTRPHQTASYRTAYREWRRKKRNPYAFRFSRNPKETAFSENQSVVDETPAAAEKKVLHKLGTLIGYSLIGCLVMENVLDKVLIFLLNRLGLPVEMFYWGEIQMFGEEHVLFWVMTAVSLLRYLLPAILLLAVLRMPLRVSIPIRMTNFRQLLAGMMLMMLISTSIGSFTVSRSDELEKYQLISDSVGMQDGNLLFYLLITLFIVPLLMELLLHGCIFQVLRQFGDLTAVILTTILAALLTHNMQDAIRIGVITLVISYFMVQTGSFLTAIFLHVIHEIYMFALYYVEVATDAFSMQWWLLILIPCIMGTGAVIYLLIDRRQHPEDLFKSRSYLGFWEQASAFFTAMPMTIFSIICVLLMVIAVILE